MKNKNCAAFSSSGSEDRTMGDMPDGNRFFPPVLGLTKREYAAIHILAGMWAAGGEGPYQSIRAAIKEADELFAELEVER